MNRSLQKIDFKRSLGVSNTTVGKSASHRVLSIIVGSILVLTISAISANTLFNDASDLNNQINSHNKNSNVISSIERVQKSPITIERTSSIAPTHQLKPNITKQQPKNKKSENWTTIVIDKGDNLTTIFKRLELSPLTAIQIAQLEGAEQLVKIKPEQTLHVLKNNQNELKKLRYKISKLESLEIERINENEFKAQKIERTPNLKIVSASGNIDSSLSMAAASVGLPDKTLYEMLAIFSWQIDFARDIQPGDSFSVIYEELTLDGEYIGNGNIVAAELVTNGNSLRAIRHEDSNGDVNYYTPQGEALKGSFLRTPMRFARVTSGFTKRRFHPVLKRWRSHKGVDYGARTGTPILTTGDGIVKFSGRKGGYGNVVIVRHGRGYETLYAHMSRFGKSISPGTRVKQGQVIGYVGSTGLATGPHLHYEFRINGRHVDPLAIDLPKAEPIPDRYKQQFITQSNLWARQLDRIDPTDSSANRIVQAQADVRNDSGTDSL